MRRGFSLVELSIVLVILGLLVGGILAGRSLIRASELRAVTTEFDRYRTATLAFKDKYFALPGDMPNATSFWGKDSSMCNWATGNVGAPGTCNGNGDGMISVTSSLERHRFWQHMSFSALIEGDYTGLGSDSPSGWEVTPGINAPISKFNPSAGWSASANPTPHASQFNVDYGNAFFFGAKVSNSYLRAPVATPENAWNIDTKIDDGNPGSGRFLANANNSCTNAATVNDFSASYRLNISTVQCALIFRKVF